VALLSASLVSATAAADVVELSVPARLEAWQSTRIEITLRGAASRFIVPVSLVLRSDAGLLMYWGIDELKGRAEPRTDGFSVEVRWLHRARGRRRGRRLEVLYPQYHQQQMSAPIPPPPATSLDLLRITPPARLAVEKLSHPLIASYDHGGRVQATLEYFVLDPLRDAPCRVSETPSRRPAFLPCRRLTRLTRRMGGELYVSRAPLRRLRRATAVARFQVRRPKFDLPHARRRARTPRGPSSYDPRRKQWILVTPGGERTLLVGARGPVVTLRGDWLETLGALSRSDETWLRWTAPTPELARRIKARLAAKGIAVSFFTFKGRRSGTSLDLTIGYRHLRALAAVMRRFGGRVRGKSISHRQLRR
jgi:hypothetical protein